MLSAYKERALFIFREIDVPFITGQGRKKVVGGVIMMFFSLIIVVVTSGFFINFFLFNSRTILSETKNPFLDRAYPASYMFRINLYTSRFLDSSDTNHRTRAHADELLKQPLPDL